MRRPLRLLMVLLAACALGGAGTGCGQREETANPHLKVPEVAPAPHGSRPAPANPAAKKK